eukprot:gb/GFBE01023144.1/.p1 GENE.gb/GFBE01023144.1/~~gb/GFBE01023144.1/.p1  ORF type:complete len:519 (+),score=61.20 gb/GFBE01023144.1/:1-1557(+)
MVAAVMWPAATASPHSRAVGLPQGVEVGNRGSRIVGDAHPSLGQPIRRQRAQAPGTFALWSPGLHQAAVQPIRDFDGLPTVSRAAGARASAPSPQAPPHGETRFGVLPSFEIPLPTGAYAVHCSSGGSSASDAPPALIRAMRSEGSRTDLPAGTQSRHPTASPQRGPSLPSLQAGPCEASAQPALYGSTICSRSSFSSRCSYDSWSGAHCEEEEEETPQARLIPLARQQQSPELPEAPETPDTPATPEIQQHSQQEHQILAIPVQLPQQQPYPGPPLAPRQLSQTQRQQQSMCHNTSSQPYAARQIQPAARCQQPGLSRLPPLGRGFNSYEVEAASPCALEEESEASGSLATSASESDEMEEQQEEDLLFQVGIRPLGRTSRTQDEDDEDEGSYTPTVIPSLPPPPVVPPLAFLPAAVFAAHYAAAAQALVATGENRRPASAGATAQRREWRAEGETTGQHAVKTPQQGDVKGLDVRPGLEPSESARTGPWRQWSLEPKAARGLQVPVTAVENPLPCL